MTHKSEDYKISAVKLLLSEEKSKKEIKIFFLCICRPQ